MVLSCIRLTWCGQKIVGGKCGTNDGETIALCWVSDIGIEGDKVGSNLRKVFALAGIWEAVLLLWVLSTYYAAIEVCLIFGYRRSRCVSEG